MQVIFLEKVLEYLEDLAVTLYEKGYFGLENTASKYVVELHDDIVMNLPVKLHRPAPSYFDQYGENMEYAVFNKNKHTQWYVFFRVYQIDGKIIYQVRYIANNHTAAQYL